MKFLKDFISLFLVDRYRLSILLVSIFLVFFSVLILSPKIQGDSLLYTESIKVLETGVRSESFVPMMIVSTYLGLSLLIFLNFFTSNVAFSWLILNGFFYVGTGIIFFSILKKIFNDSKLAFIGTIFLITNYASVTFGLGYLMDMGGWFFYTAAIYFCYKYLDEEDVDNKWIYASSGFVSLGGIFKEYAFVACIVIACVIIWKCFGDYKKIFKKGIITILISFTPFILLNIYGHYVYDYTYIDWFFFNQTAYDYQNRTIEFIKSFGSLYTFGWFLFIPGLYLLLKRLKKEVKDKKFDVNTVFICSVTLSSFAVLLWPVVTRVLFITVPALVMITCIFIKKVNVNYWIIVPILVLYTISAYLMDSFVLNFINLPF